MINTVIIEGVIQPGYQDKPGIIISKTQTGRTVTSFSLISKYGPDNKFSSGIVPVKYWQDADSTPLTDMVKVGDAVICEGNISTESWEKDGKKNFKMIVTAERVSIPSCEFDAQPIYQSEDQVKESEFDMNNTDSKPDTADEQIPF